MPSGAKAQEQQPQPNDSASGPQAGRPELRISDKPPPGFEEIDSSIETLFDIYFAGQRLGSSPARLNEGFITFTDPERLVALFPDRVMRERLSALISQRMPANEAQRCLPGRTASCGTLPAGEIGVIANPENFSVNFFLSNEFFTEPDRGPIYLGEPISGPSLIQTALMSLSTGRGALNDVRFGATLDTLASVGRNALIAQTLVRDEGINLQRAYAQRVWSDRRAAAGLLQDEQSLTFSSYRVLGAEFGSFFGTRLDDAEGTETPLEVVMPQAGRVEIYREGVLLQTVQLEAGLQRIPTRNLPSGSYPLRIVALDGDSVMFEETRVFTRVSGLPPAGEWSFSIKAGVRAHETNFGSFGEIGRNDTRFLPDVTDELVAAAGVSHRLGDASALAGQVLLVDDTVYGELSLTTYRDNLTGVIGASAGSDGSYSLLANGSWRIAVMDVNVSARHTRVGGEFEPILWSRDDFTPYFRSEDTVTASFGFPLGEGNLSLNGSYSRSPGLDDRYTIGGRYSRSIDIGSVANARVTGYALKTDRDVRAGITISFFRRISPRTTLFFGGGAEYRDPDPRSEQPDGVFPLADARVSHSRQLGRANLLSQAGVSTDADRHRAFASADIASNFGVADALVEYEKRRGGMGNDGVSIAANAFSGFTLSSGGLNVGIREPIGQAALTVGLDRSAIPQELQKNISEPGTYKVIVGNREVAEFAPNETTTIIMPAYRNYTLQLQPEQAPPYSVDLTRREIPLYPGNVVDLRYDAQFSLTLFGQLVDFSGSPLGNARVSAGPDTTFTDSDGYFLTTAQLNSEVRLFTSDGQECAPLLLSKQLVEDGGAQNSYLRLGRVTCTVAP